MPQNNRPAQLDGHYGHCLEIQTVLPLETRILDIGAPDGRLGEALAAIGMSRYLGLVEPAPLGALRSNVTSLGDRLQPLDDPRVVTRCSTDLLILRRGYERLVWGWPSFAPFEYLAIEDGYVGWDTRLALRIAASRGRLRALGMVKVIEAGTLSLYAIDGIREVRARTYASPTWGVDGLAMRLMTAGVDYAVLRWFEHLPHVEPGEDLDILIRDVDVPRFRSLVESEPGTIPIDLYSVSGIEGTDFRGAAYYVPKLAARILDNSVTHSSGMKVPSANDHLYSLVYHALYHKGASSGLPSALVPELAEAPEHDYRAAIEQAAQQCQVSLPLDMEGLDESLAAEGWRPPLDALRRLAVENEWLRKRIGDEEKPAQHGPELAVFLLRERALGHIAMEAITARLEQLGFDIITIDDLDEAARERATALIRGGNWGKGPYAVSGGRPARVITCIHYAPWPVDDSLRGRYPHLANVDTLNAKLSVRAMIEEALGPDAAFNAMHSADDEQEAWEYLQIVLPNAVERIRNEYVARVRRQSPPTDTNRTLSRGRRARVDVIGHGRDAVVRKTFTEGGRRHLKRETEAIDALSAKVTSVPQLLAQGENWFEIPYFDDLLSRRRQGLLPLRIVRRMIEALREIHDVGFDLIDAKPDNFIWDPKEGLRVVDLEFAYRAREPERSFSQGPAFHSPDRRLYEDLPVGDSAFDVRWRGRTGMSAHVLVEAGPLAQHVHRVGYRLRRLTVGPGSPLRAVARELKSRLRQSSSDARSTVFGWVLASTGKR